MVLGQKEFHYKPPKGTSDLLLNRVAKLGKHLVLAEHIRLIIEQRVDKHHCSWQGREVRRRGAEFISFLYAGKTALLQQLGPTSQKC